MYPGIKFIAAVSSLLRASIYTGCAHNCTTGHDRAIMTAKWTKKKNALAKRGETSFQFHCQYANLGRFCVVVFLVTSAPYAYILVGTSKMLNSWHKIERIRELLWDSTVFRASYCAWVVTTFTCLQGVNPFWSVSCTKYICGSSLIFFFRIPLKSALNISKNICFPFINCPQNDSI